MFCGDDWVSLQTEHDKMVNEFIDVWNYMVEIRRRRRQNENRLKCLKKCKRTSTFTCSYMTKCESYSHSSWIEVSITKYYTETLHGDCIWHEKVQPQTMFHCEMSSTQFAKPKKESFRFCFVHFVCICSKHLTSGNGSPGQIIMWRNYHQKWIQSWPKQVGQWANYFLVFVLLNWNTYTQRQQHFFFRLPSMKAIFSLIFFIFKMNLSTRYYSTIKL